MMLREKPMEIIEEDLGAFVEEISEGEIDKLRDNKLKGASELMWAKSLRKY